MQVASAGVPAASSLSPPPPWRSSRALPPRAPPPASPRRRAAPQGLGGLMHLRLCLRDSLRALAVVSALPSASRASTPLTLAARPSPKAPTCRPDLLRSISPAPSPLASAAAGWIPFPAGRKEQNGAVFSLLFPREQDANHLGELQKRERRNAHPVKGHGMATYIRTGRSRAFDDRGSEQLRGM